MPYCVMCGKYIPEGDGMACQGCESSHKTDKRGEDNLAFKLALAEERIDELETLLFGVVRNSTVLPAGLVSGKTQEEITVMTFAVIDEIKRMMDMDAIRAFMKLLEAEG